MIEQLSLFGETEKGRALAESLLKDLNGLETIWKGKFYIDHIELGKWSHISDPNKVLSVYYKASNVTKYAVDNNFIYYGKDIESMNKLRECYGKGKTLYPYRNDKDFAFCITPTFLALYVHHYESKGIKEDTWY